MGAPKGNRFWETRKTSGRRPIFKKPDDLWKVACEYFKWVEDNPFIEEKLFAYQGDVFSGHSPKMRAMSIAGLCVHIGITRSTWYEYTRKKDFSHICERIEDVMYTQKFSGAAADLLNHAIIARELGLVDKQETTGTLNVTIEGKDAQV